MTVKQINGLQAPDGSYYVTLTDGAGNLATTGGGGITSGTTVITSGTDKRVLFDDAGVVGESAGLTFTKGNGTTTSLFTLGTTGILSSPGAGIFQHGGPDIDTNAAMVAQTIRFQGALAGGTSNQTGVNTTFIASPGKGTGAGGNFVFQVAPAGSTGTTVNAAVTALTIGPTYTAFGSGGANGLVIGSAGGLGINRLDVSTTAALVFLGNSGTQSSVSVVNGGTFAFGNSSTDVSGGNALGDVRFNRGGTGILALAAGATAQTFNIYATTDVNTGTPTNYSRLSQTMASGVGTFDVQTGGTGSANVGYAWKVGGTTKLDYGVTTASKWTLTGSLNVTSDVVVGTASIFGFGAVRGWIAASGDGSFYLTNQAGTGFTRLTFGGDGGATAPSIKRSTTSLQARLSDDSAFTNIQGKLTTDTAASTGLTAGVLSATTNATIVLYDSTGQAYRVPCII